MPIERDNRLPDEVSDGVPPDGPVERAVSGPGADPDLATGEDLTTNDGPTTNEESL